MKRYVQERSINLRRFSIMAKKKEEIKFEDQSLSLITIEGKEIVVNYQVAENEDDEILMEIREALRNNEIYCGEGVWTDFEIKLGNEHISELDMKKIIGIRW